MYVIFFSLRNDQQVNLILIDADQVFFLEPIEVNSSLLFLNPRVLPDSKSEFMIPENSTFSGTIGSQFLRGN